MKVLITGGAGYIGSTTAWALKDAGHEPIIFDSLVNGRREFAEAHTFYKGDIGDAGALRQVFKNHPDIEAVIHCAALIIVPESVSRPYEYYRENVSKSVEMFRTLCDVGCKTIVFSSSAAIYDIIPKFKVTESSPTRPNSPYSRTKLVMEFALEDFCNAYGMKGIALRYFNPVGADPKMRCGPYAKNATHLLNGLVEVALGKRPEFLITGTQFETRDGTGIRDYLHVWDLARAHVCAVEKAKSLFSNAGGYRVINLGTGDGTTVREFVTAFEKVWGKAIPKREAPPRPGDIAAYYADATLARELLGWKTELSLEQGIRDALTWAQTSPVLKG